MVHRRISVEEFNERWSNLSLCMFCGEQETPYHHLQHKNEVIRMIGRDDDQTFDDKEETHRVHETLKNPAPIEEDVSSDQICEEKELVSIDLGLQEVQSKAVAEEQLNLPKGQNIEHLVGKNLKTFSTEYSSFLNRSSSNGYQKDSTWIESSLYLLCSLKDGRVWEPGGLPNKINGKPKEESKPHQKKPHQIDSFEVLSSLEPSRRSHNEQQGFSIECVEGESFGVDKIKEWLFKVEEFFSIYFTPRELKVKLALNHFDGDAANWHQSQLQEAKKVEDEIEPVTDKKTLVMPQIAINANLGFSEYNIKDESMKVMIPGNHMRMLRQLHKSKVQCKMKMQKMDLFSFGTHTEMEGNVELKHLLAAAMERFSQEVIEQNIEGGLSCGDVKFHLKHKWRFRLLESFSRLVLLAWINLWVSKAYGFSGQLQESSKDEAESFPLLNFSAGQHLLWMQNNSEPIFIVSELMRKKKLGYKAWMFKYKVDEEDQGILQSRTENSLTRREISTFIFQAEALLFESKEPAVSATPEPAIFQSASSHGMITRGKDGMVKTNLRYSLLAVQRIWEKETHDVDITDAYYVLQEEFEQVENHTPCSVVKLERPQDHDALLLSFPGDERFQIKHKWRFKLLLSILELELYLDSLVLPTSYAHQFDIISLIILMRVEWSVFFSTKPDGFFFSTNLEVKVSLKGEDVIQEKRRKRNGTCGT